MQNARNNSTRNKRNNNARTPELNDLTKQTLIESLLFYVGIVDEIPEDTCPTLEKSADQEDFFAWVELVSPNVTPNPEEVTLEIKRQVTSRGDSCISRSSYINLFLLIAASMLVPVDATQPGVTEPKWKTDILAFLKEWNPIQMITNPVEFSIKLQKKQMNLLKPPLRAAVRGINAGLYGVPTPEEAIAEELRRQRGSNMAVNAHANRVNKALNNNPSATECLKIIATSTANAVCNWRSYQGLLDGPRPPLKGIRRLIDNILWNTVCDVPEAYGPPIKPTNLPGSVDLAKDALQAYWSERKAEAENLGRFLSGITYPLRNNLPGTKKNNKPVLRNGRNNLPKAKLQSRVAAFAPLLLGQSKVNGSRYLEGPK